MQALLLSSYSSALRSFGFMGEALKIRLQEIELTNLVSGENSEDYAISLWSLGSLCFSLDQLRASDISRVCPSPGQQVL